MGKNSGNDKVIEKKQLLSHLYKEWCGEEILNYEKMPPSGSYREYYRLGSWNNSAIGVYNHDKKENLAFLKFTIHFLNKGLPVPEIYAENLAEDVYLIEDLGNLTLLNYLNGQKPPINIVKSLYKQAVTDLLKFQTEGRIGLDFSYCYPRDAFDKQSIMWDLNYFKHYFLKFSKILFDEQLLENEFNEFAGYLLQAENHFFMYRDFQSRNIMIRENKLFYIDYQGGRKGALQYDLASILFEAKTDLPHAFREELLEFYLENLARFKPELVSSFRKYYPGFILVRLLQAFGAYGFRGLYENKPLFLESIPKALKVLAWLMQQENIGFYYPELFKSFERLLQSEELLKIGVSHGKFKLRVNSFSYKSGIPFDETLHGGGFVFDCRPLPNPGRMEEYKNLTGKDLEVEAFFADKPEMGQYLEYVHGLVEFSVKEYQKRGFNELMVSFGCTGGQHRSVYCAENLVKFLRSKFNIDIMLNHRELSGLLFNS